jgi:PAS domain S-box-containing protein
MSPESTAQRESRVGGHLPTNLLIQQSWYRSAAANVSAESAPPSRRVAAAELQRRQDANALLIQVAAPHLHWLAEAFSTRHRVAYLVDADGIVLHTTGDADAVASFGLAPGFDWSEPAMGTNGAGTALVAKQPVAIVGCDHWSAAWHNATCLGAPIVAPDGQVIGAIDLSLDTQDGDADRLTVPAYAAYAISQELARRIAEEGHTRLSDDMVRLRQAEDALRESEARFRLMADTSPLMIWVHDAEGALEFVNNAYCRFFGVSEGDVLGGNWQPLVHPDDVAQYVTAFETALHSGTPYFAEARARRADGEWRWIASYGAPRVSGDGRIVGMVGSSPDITDIKRAIADAQEASKAKDEFLATVAHELRQPIAAAGAALQVMALRPGIDAGERARHVIERQVHHMTRLVEDLLEAERIIRGAVTVRAEIIDLSGTLRHVAESMAPLIAEREHVFDVSIADIPLLVNADAARLQQVFGNLLSNAARYTDPGGCVALRAGIEGSSICITVEDTGRGIESAHLSRIFELFVRGTSDGPGFGIGLAVARKLVELQGGTLIAHSDGLGTGSRFVVTLPAVVHAAPPVVPDHLGARPRPD